MRQADRETRTDQIKCPTPFSRAHIPCSVKASQQNIPRDGDAKGGTPKKNGEVAVAAAAALAPSVPLSVRTSWSAEVAEAEDAPPSLIARVRDDQASKEGRGGGDRPTDRGTGYLEESPVRCGKGEEVGDEAAAAAMAAMAAPPSTSFTSSASF